MKYTFIILTSETCGHCQKFKASGKADELKGKLNGKVDVVSISVASMSSNIDPKYNSKLNDLEGKWYPSFYIVNTDSLYDSSKDLGIHVMAGNIEGNKINLNRSQVSMQVDSIVDWINSIVGPDFSKSIKSNSNQNNMNVQNNSDVPAYSDFNMEDNLRGLLKYY